MMNKKMIIQEKIDRKRINMMKIITIPILISIIKINNRKYHLFSLRILILNKHQIQKIRPKEDNFRKQITNLTSSKVEQLKVKINQDSFSQKLDRYIFQICLLIFQLNQS